MAENDDTAHHPLGNVVKSFDVPINAGGDSSEATSRNGSRAVLTIGEESLSNPAFLVNRDLEIVWHNKAAVDHIWQTASHLNDGSEQRFIFELLFDNRFQEKIVNWRQWVRFFLQHAVGMLSFDALNDRLNALSVPWTATVEKMLASLKTSVDPAFDKRIYSGRIRQILASGQLTSYWVVATDFDEGRLFVFDSLHPALAVPGMARAADIEQKLEIVRQNPQHAVQSAVHILVARLHNADILRTELLADEYCRLLGRLWQKAVEVLENYGGIVAQESDSGLMSYFLPSESNGDTNPLYVLECALELKQQMVEFSREWKIRKGWLHDIELNLGVHSDQEYLGLLQSALGETLTVFGDSLQVASFLARIGRQGQIWTTKALVNNLSADALKLLRFGVFRQDNHRQVFISRSFSRIRDLPDKAMGPETTGGKTQRDLLDIAVTQIFDLHR